VVFVSQHFSQGSSAGERTGTKDASGRSACAADAVASSRNPGAKSTDDSLGRLELGSELQYLAGLHPNQIALDQSMVGEVNRAIDRPPRTAQVWNVVLSARWIDQVAACAVEQRVEREHLDAGRRGFGVAERTSVMFIGLVDPLETCSVFDYIVSPRPLGRTTAST